MPMSDFNSILEFWFNGIDDQTPIRNNQPPFNTWFANDAAFDQAIRERFEADWTAGRDGGLQAWESTDRGRLALIILFDQFSRNMYRNTPKMYETDPLALAMAVRSIKEGTDRQLQLIERVFLYMPLTHAEDLKMQELCVDCFERLLKESKKKNPANAHYYEYNLSYARKYLRTIQEFGRFPHRNAILKRSSTPEELAFLKK
jgi:uncharacterized protein (DUF924 family)